MRVERAVDGPSGPEVVTTGATFRFGADGVIDAAQRLPFARAAVQFQISDGGARPAAWALISSAPESTVLRLGDAMVTVRGDSVLTLRTASPATLAATPAFHSAYDEQDRGRWLVLDETGGFGVYPLRAARAATVAADAHGSRHWRLRAGDETWLAVFPPRAENPVVQSLALAHEGRPQTLALGLDAAYPSRAILADAARHCGIVAVHAYVWKAAPLATRLRPSRAFLRRCEWRTPRHEPADPARFQRVINDARELGLRVLLYLSPRHTTAPDLFTEVARVLATHEPDGLYLDEVADDLVTLDRVVRGVRDLLGPSRLLYLNAAAEPFGTPRVWAPFVDAHADLVLRGSEGRGGLPLQSMLRYAVSGRNTSGAAGYWCNHGGRLRESAPTDREIDLTVAAGAHLWRRSLWGAAALERFDARYYAANRAD